MGRHACFAAVCSLAPGQTFLMAGALEAAQRKLNLVLLLTLAVIAAVLAVLVYLFRRAH
ncbi:MAG: hypothetical protein GVY09_03465 [Gammaproteobacteria bacterium]|jgi:membrane protein DedA with SNARE-associated domain|nr:hypothetical protein [Gammaproteobacteria bacterium]